MGYRSLQECVADFERAGHLVRVHEEVDPHLEMAAIHLRVFERGGPALLFENVKGTQFPAVSNMFGTMDRSRFIFHDTLERVKALVGLKYDPLRALRQPVRHAGALAAATAALPRRTRQASGRFSEIRIRDLPQIVNWPRDGGPFITLPQVLTEDVRQPGVLHANLGMYRIQLAGNKYEIDREVGLHYQIHRGIGIHQTLANEAGVPLKVSIFVGGPPAHTLAAVMPLPEGLPEVTFAGALAGGAFRWYRDPDGFVISADADFVITGTVHPHETKPEGPFGDHLGYYSLAHPFPVMRVGRVLHRRGAIWPFTVVGRPPQEDTSFGALIHELTGSAIPQEIPGVRAVHAVDAAGVHPLLLAVGSERYTPYIDEQRPQEILTIANHILGTNQLSLAKYLWICAAAGDVPGIHDVAAFMGHILARIDFTRDLHFQTRTTIDTLDYSGTGLNAGSKLVLAAAGAPRRHLLTELPSIDWPRGYDNVRLVFPGVLAMEAPAFTSRDTLLELERELEARLPDGIALIVLCDDAALTAASVANFCWVTFTRSNPSHDVHGVGSFIEHKHWGCRGPLIIDARPKPQHAPPLERDPATERRVDRLGQRGASLHGII